MVLRSPDRENETVYGPEWFVAENNITLIHFCPIHASKVE